MVGGALHRRYLFGFVGVTCICCGGFLLRGSDQF
ncbi:unnamed protein product [Brassica oleracea]